MSKKDKILFLVSSAINTNFGTDQQSRFFQTINTFNSINANVPNAEIWLIESSANPVDPKYLARFPKNVRLIAFWNDKRIKSILEEAELYWKYTNKVYTWADELIEEYKKQITICYIKSVTESYVFERVLKMNEFKDFKRVFKISGRYCLLPTFNLEDHLHEGKYSFYKKIESAQRLETLEWQYLCFLWSFCPSIIDDVRNLYANMAQYLNNIYGAGKITDLEHAFYKYLDPSKISNFKQFHMMAKVSDERYFMH